MRRRRTRAEVEQLKDGLFALVRDHQPVTVRQTFYLAVSAGLIPKNETEYNNVVCRLLGDMREDGELPWAWIVDYTRMMRKPVSYNGIEDALAATARHYRRDLWQDINERAEIWIEKDALIGAVVSETERYDVPLMPCRGYPSKTFRRGAADAMTHYGKPTYIYYVGDYDPSGEDISRLVNTSIRKYAPTVPMTFTRLAVLPEQIVTMNLPMRPTKQTDSRAGLFDDDSVEAEAIDPETLRQMVRDAIESHIPDGALDRHAFHEKEERKILRLVADPDQVDIVRDMVRESPDDFI